MGENDLIETWEKAMHGVHNKIKADADALDMQKSN